MDAMKVFVSYRRDDSAGYAGRLFDDLSARLGSRNVFLDINTIEPGDDFRQVIAPCDVVLVMIGRVVQGFPLTWSKRMEALATGKVD